MIADNKGIKALLEILSNRLKSLLKDYKVASEYHVTKEIMNTITWLLHKSRLIDEIDIEPVERQDILTKQHFDSLFNQTEDALIKSSDLLSNMADMYNEELIQSNKSTNAVTKINEVINTKVEEISTQISEKFKNHSINNEQIIKLDFSKDPQTQSYDVVNNVLMLKKISSERLTDPDAYNVTITNNAFDYENLTGATNGRLIDNYLSKDLFYNTRQALLDNLLTTKMVVQSVDEKPHVVINVDTANKQFQFNLISIFTNELTYVTHDNKTEQQSRDVYVLKPSQQAEVEIKHNSRYIDKYIPIVRLSIGEITKDLSYFQSMKLRDEDTFNDIIYDESALTPNVLDNEDLPKSAEQDIIEKHIRVNELTVSDVLIESNRYDTSAEWKSGKIETGRDIISIEVYSDEYIPTGCSIKYYVKIGNAETWKEIESTQINNQYATDDIFIPNRIVLDESKITSSDGDLILTPPSEKNYAELMIKMESNDSTYTPLIYDLELRIKVERE